MKISKKKEKKEFLKNGSGSSQLSRPPSIRA
jgi:hypothetical protein